MSARTIIRFLLVHAPLTSCTPVESLQNFDFCAQLPRLGSSFIALDHLMLRSQRASPKWAAKISLPAEPCLRTTNCPISEWRFNLSLLRLTVLKMVFVIDNDDNNWDVRSVIWLCIRIFPKNISPTISSDIFFPPDISSPGHFPLLTDQFYSTQAVITVIVPNPVLSNALL